MLVRQVITISPEGAISGLQRKPGQGIDLRRFGKARIERASEIEFDEETQRWRIHILTGDWAGMVLARCHFLDHVGSVPEGGLVNEDTLIVEFDDYEVAVRAEVLFLDAIRLNSE